MQEHYSSDVLAVNVASPVSGKRAIKWSQLIYTYQRSLHFRFIKFVNPVLLPTTT